MSVSVVALLRFEPTLKRTIGENIADLRRVGKSGSGLRTRTPECAIRYDRHFTANAGPASRSIAKSANREIAFLFDGGFQRSESQRIAIVIGGLSGIPRSLHTCISV